MKDPTDRYAQVREANKRPLNILLLERMKRWNLGAPMTEELPAVTLITNAMENDSLQLEFPVRLRDQAEALATDLPQMWPSTVQAALEKCVDLNRLEKAKSSKEVATYLLDDLLTALLDRESRNPADILTQEP